MVSEDMMEENQIEWRVVDKIFSILYRIVSNELLRTIEYSNFIVFTFLTHENWKLEKKQHKTNKYIAITLYYMIVKVC